MSSERLYLCKTPASMARKAVYGVFYEDTINQLAFTDDPNEVVVSVDTNGPISPVTGKQVVRISVAPHHEMSQDVAERIWQQLAWTDVEGNDWVDPVSINVEAKGWDCRMKIFY